MWLRDGNESRNAGASGGNRSPVYEGENQTKIPQSEKEIVGMNDTDAREGDGVEVYHG